MRYALRHGMPGGGYIFSTSNCIYTGMRLARYELMLDVWRRYGNYDEYEKGNCLSEWRKRNANDACEPLQRG